MNKTIDPVCDELRKDIQALKERVADLHNSSVFDAPGGILSRGNVPEDQHCNMHANITLVFRALEDARMRLGKVMQASQGGVSILDKK